MEFIHSLLVVRVVHMTRAETQRGPTGATVLPVVVGICDSEVASVLVAIIVAVSHQTGLPVVVEVGAGE